MFKNGCKLIKPPKLFTPKMAKIMPLQNCLILNK